MREGAVRRVDGDPVPLAGLGHRLLRDSIPSPRSKEAGNSSETHASPGTDHILGYELLRTGTGATVDAILESMRAGRSRRWLACLNPHSYAAANADSRFRESLRAADWLIPDGVGILLASRVLGGAIRERVTGSDIFGGVHAGLERAGGGRVFFLGSTEETLAAIRRKMAKDFPHVTVAGTYAPPFCAEFNPEQLNAMVSAVNAASPDVLWVAMTAPRQEMWLHQNIARLDVKFAAAIGAVFDFYTGRVKRSPQFFQRWGLEWLPRLLQEPSRLWKRTFVSAPLFLSHVARSALMPSEWRSRLTDGSGPGQTQDR